MNVQQQIEVERTIKSIDLLYHDIDACIGKLVKTRIEKDPVGEGKAMCDMESLLVSSLQEFSFIRDLLVEIKSGINPEPLSNEEYTKATLEIDEKMKKIQQELASKRAAFEMAVKDFHFTD